MIFCNILIVILLIKLPLAHLVNLGNSRFLQLYNHLCANCKCSLTHVPVFIKICNPPVASFYYANILPINIQHCTIENSCAQVDHNGSIFGLEISGFQPKCLLIISIYYLMIRKLHVIHLYLFSYSIFVLEQISF